MEGEGYLVVKCKIFVELSCLVLSGIFCYKSRYKHPPSQTPDTPCLFLRYAFVDFHRSTEVNALLVEGVQQLQKVALVAHSGTLLAKLGRLDQHLGHLLAYQLRHLTLLLAVGVT
jgi:hypothetical protein